MILPFVQMLSGKVASTLVAAFFIEMTLVAHCAGFLSETTASQIDLIEELHVHNRTYKGISLADGFPLYSPALSFSGDSRHLQLPRSACERAAELLTESNEFTFLAYVKQDFKNSGSILSFSQDNNRILELQSSGRKDEIRFHYRHKNAPYTEAFRYRLADEAWHRLALRVSGTQVDLYIDCNRIYRRSILEVDRDIMGIARNASLWLGQRSGKHFLFKGSLQNTKIVAQTNGHLLQCPQLDTECPTCGQFQAVQRLVSAYESNLRSLESRVKEAEERLRRVEECECFKSCHINGSVHPDGATWKQDCDICSCVHGEVTCRPVQCPPAPCKNPEVVSGECCPVCKKQCLINGRVLEHKEMIRRSCLTCECNDGTVTCKHIDPQTMCPELSCPVSERFQKENECCQFCPGVDYCAQGNDCHANASCRNLKTKYSCDCNAGFFGNGRVCQDVDECRIAGGRDGHHCRQNTRCVNLPGSYKCECLSGFVPDANNPYNCVDFDECQAGRHTCHSNAQCTNTPGSFKCQCLPGYKGNGFNCDPVCNETCLNGGKCVAPNTCSCRRGYQGATCEEDIDECESGTHRCHINSKCMNLPGWYYCECKDGYVSKTVDTESGYGVICQDINECEEERHTCHDSARCVNDDGGYHCECKTSRDSSSCSYHCLDNGIERRTGETWTMLNNACSRCSCNKGVVTCQENICNCNDAQVDINCCPQCDRESRCHHQADYAVTFRSGQTWMYQCQLCECMFGEVDCWDLDCPPTKCADPIRRDGDCCARCEDDPCDFRSDGDLSSNGTESNEISTVGAACVYEGRLYSSGDLVPTSEDRCTSCKCKNGRLCCTYSSACDRNQDISSVLHNRVERSSETPLASNAVPPQLASASAFATSSSDNNATLALALAHFEQARRLGRPVHFERELMKATNVRRRLDGQGPEQARGPKRARGTSG